MSQSLQWIDDGQHTRLEKIAKGWGDMLRRGEFEEPIASCYYFDHALDLEDPQYCIVGTSHKFIRSYHDCRICESFSEEFMDIREDGPAPFKKTLAKFLDHFEDKHPDLIKIPLVRT